MKHVFVTACWLLTIVQSSFGTAPSIAANREAHVLILNGTDPYLAPYSDTDDAIRAILTNQSAERIVLFSEALDAQRLSEDELQPRRLALLAKKYEGVHIDVVVVFGRGALAFFKRQGERLWPDARVVYRDFTGDPVDRTELPHNAIGIVPHNGITATIDMARRMQPDARRIFVVSGASAIDKRAEQLAREHLATAIPTGVEYLSGLPLPELIARIAVEPADTIVIYLAQSRDRDGRRYAPQEVLREVSGKSRAPVYGAVENYLGFGIVGGSMESYEQRASLVAEQVQAAIDGRPIDPGRALLTTAGRCIADARALRRWSLDASRLPEGCDVRFDHHLYWLRYFWRSVGILVIVLSQGALIVALLIQLRRRRLAEEALQSAIIDATHASRLAVAGELTASIAHEIKQPLAAILSNVQTAEFLLGSEGNLRTDKSLRDALRPILADVRRDDVRASEVIGRLRTLLAKHEVGHEPVDLNGVVADVCVLLRGEANHRGMRIEMRNDSVAQVLGDRIQIQQVLINLIMNAMDAVEDVSEERRTIIVSVTGSEQSSSVTVRDLGQGIRTSELAKIFKSFYSSKHTGMGLGLSIARTIVEAHGGCIEVTSRSGEGSEFRASFPCMESTVQDLRTADAS